MNEHAETPTKPRFGIGTIVNHPHFGTGRVVNYEAASYVLVFKGGESKRVSFAFEGLTASSDAGNPEKDLIKEAVREVLGEHGWIDVDIELSARWAGGTLRLEPGKTETQSKEVPIEAFFKKLIGVREKLRVLEQKLNNHPSLSPEEKLELEGYITRCYGSLTTFNALFASRDSAFTGSGKSDGNA